jgi:hypothetical protein
MSYQLALETAGAKVILFENFGSYQGSWWAKVEHNNEVWWVNGYYGSCSGCDAFESEFAYENHTHTDCDYYNPIYDGIKDDCEKCQEVKIRLKNFGESYLIGHTLTQSEAENEVNKHEAYWDSEDKRMIDFIKNNKI